MALVIMENTIYNHDSNCCFLADWLSYQDSENVFERLEDTLQEFMAVTSWVAGHNETSGSVSETISKSKPIRYDWGSTTSSQHRTG